MNFNKYGRTAQLFDYQTMSDGLVGGVLNSDGTITTNVASSSWAITKYIPVAGREFTLQRQASGGATSICLYDSNQTYITGLAYNGNGTVTVSANTDVSYIRFTYYRTENTGNIMLNEGSTAKPFEPYGNTWVDIPHYIYKTATDTLTTLPADIYPNAATATVGLKGNMVQTGTPTPQNPIQPSETGDLSSNMFDINAFMQGVVPTRCTVDYNNLTNTITINSTGSDASTGNNNSYHIPIIGGETYTLSWDTNSDAGLVYIFENGLADSAHLHAWNSMLKRGTLIAQSDTTYFVVRVGCDSPNKTKTYTNIMLNLGETALPYEPYGYKIPISSASTTTPVYLGEVQSTRLVKKYEMTGNENIQTITDSISETGTKVYGYSYDALGMTDILDYYGTITVINYPVFVCSHFKEKTEGYESFKSIKNGEIGANSAGGGANLFLIFATNQYTTGETFKAYLQAQYANGTPVTVWYVLAEPKTGIVNEPIRKIGDYADTVSGISIPTIAGANTLSIGTTLQPSEVTVNYKGWHSVADVHERESGVWT